MKTLYVEVPQHLKFRRDRPTGGSLSFRPQSADRRDRLRQEHHSGLAHLADGGRGSTLQVRTNERMATVEGLFTVGKERRQAVEQILAGVGVEVENGSELLIRREIHANGRSRIFVEDQSVTAATLRLLQPFLVAIHGQGEQRSLLSTQSQMDLLDSFGANQALREKVSEAYGHWRATLEELSDLEREMMERERAADLLQYELSEIKQIAPKPSEDQELATERKLLTNSEKLFQLGTGAYTELYEKDGSVIDRLAALCAGNLRS